MKQKVSISERVRFYRDAQGCGPVDGIDIVLQGGLVALFNGRETS